MACSICSIFPQTAVFKYIQPNFICLNSQITLTVLVQVENINDNAPSFAQSKYTLDVNEVKTFATEDSIMTLFQRLHL